MRNNLTLAKFEHEIQSAVEFSTEERWVNLIMLIERWGNYIENPIHNAQDKWLHIDWMEYPQEIWGPQIDLTLSNVALGEFRLHREKQFYLYLHNSRIGSLKFADPQNSLDQKVIQWDWISTIEVLEFDNINFRDEEEESLIIFNVNIKNFRIIRTINLSEKIQILGCHIENFIVNGSDLWKMLFIENAIDNLWIIGSACYRTVLLSTKIGKLRRDINQVKWISNKAPDISHEAFAGVCRQLKNAFDESKSFADWDRFYAAEMRHTMYSLSSLDSRKYLLILHWLSSNFGTSWIASGIFIALLWVLKTWLELRKWATWQTVSDLFRKFIENINPYTNFAEVKSMSPLELGYLILLSFGIYQFILAIRRSSKR